MSKKLISIAEVLVIVCLAAVPLFTSFPYRVNIFLSWEGAYRISLGEIPFRDFGTPLGGMYWVIPGMFFKIFGPQMISLIKAQVFINILSGLAFRSILKSFSVNPGISFCSILLFCLSYSFVNFWPWYNHTVIVYELIALAFVLKYIFVKEGTKFSYLYLVAGAFFVFASFFTKQDGGGMAFAICAAVLAYHGYLSRKWLPLGVYLASVVAIMGGIMVWLSSYRFGYWFNHGQAPHTARISIKDIADEFFMNSQWIKFYLFVIAVLLVVGYKKGKDLFLSNRDGIFLLFTIAILGEAAVFQVTSYTPPDNNIFYHAFALSYILFLLERLSAFEFLSKKIVYVGAAGVLLWWSGTYWKYIQRLSDRNGDANPAGQIVSNPATGENVVNKLTYKLTAAPADDASSDNWAFSNLYTLKKIYLPKSTVDGIERVKAMDVVKNNKDIKFLNMSELTTLAADIPYKLEHNENYPLWFHLGVGMFNSEAAMFEDRLKKKEYDIVLFEHIKNLNNFYPFRIRNVLKDQYKLVDSFQAPRRGDTQGLIEVYVK
ncbi:MAG: hypothetical protein EOO02_01285 [Chitinophagaceae bacterium]|nr:MAG: hypothetical protein EOO02_01285 [Chitinophagaceae bacterium]